MVIRKTKRRDSVQFYQYHAVHLFSAAATGSATSMETDGEDIAGSNQDVVMELMLLQTKLKGQIEKVPGMQSTQDASSLVLLYRSQALIYIQPLSVEQVD